MIVTRDETLDAIDRMTEGADCLCAAFDWKFDWPLVDSLPRLLNALGGRTRGIGYFWPEDEINQRLLFLAFLLTRHDDITGAQT
jgi:hypothetical protein